MKKTIISLAAIAASGAAFAEVTVTGTLAMATGMAVPTSAGVPLGLGVGLVAEYTLSKRTCLIANYASWDATIGAVARNNETNLLLSHTF